MDVVTGIDRGMVPPAGTGRGRPDLTAVVTRWERRGPPTLPRLYRLGRHLVRTGATDTELAAVASELMWQHRGRRLPTGGWRPPGAEEDLSGACRFLYYCVLRHANYLFDLASCRSLATEAHERWPDDPWFTALLGMAELADDDPRGDRRLRRLTAWCDEPRVRHLVLTAYIISRDPRAPARVIELTAEMRQDGQDDVVVGFREAVARRRIGDLPGALSAIDRALHELATGPYDGPTRTFVNEQLRQERERILDRSDTDVWARSAQRTPQYGEQVPTRGAADMDGSEHVTVTIRDDEGNALVTGELSPSPRGLGDPPGTGRARLRVPLWSVSLGDTVCLELPDGSLCRIRVRDVTSMEGMVATVNVDLAEAGHRTARSPAPAPTRRSAPA